MCKELTFIDKIIHQIVIVLFTGIIILIININDNAFGEYVYMFYTPGMFIPIMLTGGIHSAPSWVGILGIWLQNILLWSFLRDFLCYLYKKYVLFKERDKYF